MIEFCNERLSSTIQNIKIFQGQKALPSQYENIPAFEKDFIGYNYEFLNQVIADHRKKIDKWLNHFLAFQILFFRSTCKQLYLFFLVYQMVFSKIVNLQ